MLSNKYNNLDEVQNLEANTIVPNIDTTLSDAENKHVGNVDTISSLRPTISKPKHPAVTVSFSTNYQYIIYSQTVVLLVLTFSSIGCFSPKAE